MRVMAIAFATVIVIAFAADYGLDRIGFSAAEQQSSPSVRLD